ncbi:MAG TPA: MmcQ/YjbR family DNA-binding protein [Isosphaeraceae bacterium]|nr:MmcQ/YjbR family DNA-binding protein [Isosphaeraceae bacterium]
MRQVAGALPGAVEGTSYGTPAFHVRKTLFVRLHQDGDALVVKVAEADRAMRMRADPETFSITDHYRNYPWMLVRLATVDPADLADLVTEAWRLGAPKRRIDARDDA